MSVSTTRLCSGPFTGMVRTRFISACAAGRCDRVVGVLVDSGPAVERDRDDVVLEAVLRLEPGPRRVERHHVGEELGDLDVDRLDLVRRHRPVAQDLLQRVHAPVRGAAARVQPDRRPARREVPRSEPVEHLLGIAVLEAEQARDAELAVEDVAVGGEAHRRELGRRSRRASPRCPP